MNWLQRPSHPFESWKTFHRNNRDTLSKAARIYAKDGKKAARKYRKHHFAPKSPGRPPAVKREPSIDHDDSPDQRLRPSTSKARQPKSTKSTKPAKRSAEGEGEAAVRPKQAQARDEDRSDEGSEPGTPSPRQNKGKEKATAEDVDESGGELVGDFTVADDELWITQQAKAVVRGYNPHAVWEYLGQQHSHHSADKWQQQYEGKVLALWEQINTKVQHIKAKLEAKAAEAAKGSVATALETANAKVAKKMNPKVMEQAEAPRLRAELVTSEDEEEDRTGACGPVATEELNE